jgi:GntR family transcriptional regulator, hexuronate regulon transcriptional repressor
MAERLFQGIADEVTALIQEGVFPPGSRLPGERELAERFNVSRVTIREAEIALQALGLVKIRTGAGVYVTNGPKQPDDELPHVSALELTEARALFESEAAALAAPTITEEALQRLDELLEIMSEEDGDDGRTTDADREFHMLIASASGNQAITHVIRTLWKLRTELPEVRMTHAAVCHHNGHTRHDEHAAIVDALRRRAPDDARIAMRGHFHRLLQAMLDVTEERQLSEIRRKSEESRERYLLSTRL